MFDRTRRRRHDVEVEDFRRQPQRRAGVGHVDHAGDVALTRRRSQNRVSLRAGIAELLEVLDRVQASLPIGDMYIEAMLLTLLVDLDAPEDRLVLVFRPHWRRLECSVLDAVFGGAALDHGPLDMPPPRHFDRAAE